MAGENWPTGEADHIKPKGSAVVAAGLDTLMMMAAREERLIPTFIQRRGPPNQRYQKPFLMQ